MNDDTNIVPFPQPDEQQKVRVLAEAKRLAGLAEVDWKFQIGHGSAERLGIEPKQLEQLVKAEINDQKKAKRQDEKDDRERERAAKAAEKEEREKAEQDARAEQKRVKEEDDERKRIAREEAKELKRKQKERE